MHIAFVSYEYPPDTADGGIATYVFQAARALSERGHEVEVFAASRDRTQSGPEGNLRVHRLRAANRREFPEAIVPVFAARHSAAPFDMVEGSDFNADACEIARRHPKLPLVVRLHTPRYLTALLNRPALRAAGTPADSASAPAPPALELLPDYDRDSDPEYLHALRADEITAPSAAICDLVARHWNLDAERIAVIPNVYAPEPELTRLPLQTAPRTVLFLGRLEARKGVMDIAKAIPAVLERCPDARFRFVGSALESPEPGVTMRDYLERLLRPYAASVTFEDAVPRERVPAVLADAAVCALPSLWENFPYACLEAMAAGRAIVGSESGGMAEMLAYGAGLLVPPADPAALAEAVARLLTDAELRAATGFAARTRVLTLYSPESLMPLQEASYARAIRRRKEHRRHTQ